jgi:hypothetical protein
MSKVCTRCGEVKPLDEFYVRGDNRGLRSHCKTCHVASSTVWNCANRNAQLEYMRGRHLKRKYGLGPGEYEEVLEAQGGCCAICGTDTPGGRGRFHVDHDHGCCPGEKACAECLRGLLCHRCNTDLGGYERLRANPRTEEYLAQFQKARDVAA